MSLSKSNTSGHPPLHTRYASSLIFRLLVPEIVSTPPNKSLILTSPLDSFDSKRLILRIVSQANLPVPLCEVDERSPGTDDPVSMKCPLPSL